MLMDPSVKVVIVFGLLVLLTGCGSEDSSTSANCADPTPTPTLSPVGTPSDAMIRGTIADAAVDACPAFQMSSAQYYDDPSIARFGYDCFFHDPPDFVVFGVVGREAFGDLRRYATPESAVAAFEEAEQGAVEEQFLGSYRGVRAAGVADELPDGTPLVYRRHVWLVGCWVVTATVQLPPSVNLPDPMFFNSKVAEHGLDAGIFATCQPRA
jgi:hypothetical protein